jgi:hypothetical protein
MVPAIALDPPDAAAEPGVPALSLIAGQVFVTAQDVCGVSEPQWANMRTQATEVTVRSKIDSGMLIPMTKLRSRMHCGRDSLLRVT